MTTNAIQHANSKLPKHRTAPSSAYYRNIRILCTAAFVIAGWWAQAASETVDVSNNVTANGLKPERSTLVVKRLGDGKHWVSNPTRANLRFSPASTSKVPHTLVALDRGLANPDSLFTWDRKPRNLKAWNRDHTLSSAFSNSVVWVYQRIAQRAGPQILREGLTGFDYGNANVGSEENLTTYWLDGTLLISANEQIAFLSKLAWRRLALKESTYADAQDIMLSDTGAGWRMYSKTGWRHRDNILDIGWFVGWLECVDDIYVFALNMDMPDRSYVEKRKQVTLAVLGEIGAFNCK